MIEVLDPMVRIPGVRLAALITLDGVPVAVRTARRGAVSGAGDLHLEDDPDSVCGLARSWFDDLTRTGGLLTWGSPARMVLRAARGTVVMQAAPNGVLLAVLERGASPEELRLPMEGAVARVQRVLRNMGGGAAQDAAANTDGVQAPLPQRGRGQEQEPVTENADLTEAPGEIGQIGTS